MLALRVTYLLGRVYSARFEDGDGKADTEWPPHPSRLFSALTAAWGDAGAEDELRPALEWLEQQDPPRILFAEQTERKLVQAFVPVNDSGTLPEDRSRKGRVFPSGSLGNPHVYFVWDASPSDEVRSLLDRIALRSSSVGHSSSLVSVELVNTIDTEGLTEWRPGGRGGERMRVPSEGRLEDLIQRHRRFQETGAKIDRPNGGRTILYGPVHQPRQSAARGTFGEMIVLQRNDGPPASLRAALSVTSALRGAVLKHGPQPPPEFLSGHGPGSTPGSPIRSEGPHVAFVPLANVGYSHSDGDLKGAALVLPRTFTSEQRRVCWQTAEEIATLTMDWGKWRISPADAEAIRSLLPQTWTQASKVWTTVTPFVFDRYPKETYGEEAEHVVREAFVRSGFPPPVEIDLHYNPWLSGAPKASWFAPARSRNGKPQRFHCHVRARFDCDVEGPVLAGAGRFYGYGLFRQVWDGGRK